MAPTRSIWWTRRSVAAHVTLLVLIPAFIALCVWQLGRALSGNWLSWMYVFEWPIFTVYAVYVWWKLVHEARTPVAGEETDGTEATVPPDVPAESVVRPAPTPPPGARPGDDGSDVDAELAAYNRYLEELDAYDRRRGR
ncbi:MAG TPA: hypothetical protein VKG43_07065 [Acidimicrobiales bacterium]|nr:hypothetical protein [Acidimicrobiales bacterium]